MWDRCVLGSSGARRHRVSPSDSGDPPWPLPGNKTGTGRCPMILLDGAVGVGGIKVKAGAVAPRCRPLSRAALISPRAADLIQRAGSANSLARRGRARCAPRAPGLGRTRPCAGPRSTGAGSSWMRWFVSYWRAAHDQRWPRGRDDQQAGVGGDVTPTLAALSDTYGRSSRTTLTGVSATWRNRLKPASSASCRTAAGPAWAPSATPPGWARAAGVHWNVDAA